MHGSSVHCYKISSALPVKRWWPYCSHLSSLLCLYLIPLTSQICKLSSHHILIPFALSFDLPLQVKTVPHPIILVYYSLCTFIFSPFFCTPFPFVLWAFLYSTCPILHFFFHITTLPHFHHCWALTPLSLSHFYLFLFFFEVVLIFLFFLSFAYFISPYSTGDKMQPVFVHYPGNDIGFVSNMTGICFRIYLTCMNTWISYDSCHLQNYISCLVELFPSYVFV
jgi:hypothetical protein